MRIAYFVHINLDPHSGVFKKVLAQQRAWLRAGNQTKLFILTRLKSYIEVDACVSQYTNEGLINSLVGRMESLKIILLKVQAWNPDVVYTRMDMYYPYVVALGKRFPLVLEINSDELAELKMYSKLKWVYHKLTKGRTISVSSGIVSVTKELAFRKEIRKFNRPIEVIANGIELNAFAPLPATEGGKTRLCFIGQSGFPWHGIDKIYELALACSDWEIEVIGCTQANFSNFVAPNLHFRGVLSRGDYEVILRQSDCALGTLALHRNGMQEACPLKTREYLAFGLPVITGYEDTDFAHRADFLLQLRNDESNVSSSIDQIRSFVHGWKGKRVSRAKINHLDVSVKEAQRLAFFKYIVRKGSPEGNR